MTRPNVDPVLAPRRRPSQLLRHPFPVRSAQAVGFRIANDPPHLDRRDPRMGRGKVDHLSGRRSPVDLKNGGPESTDVEGDARLKATEAVVPVPLADVQGQVPQRHEPMHHGLDRQVVDGQGWVDPHGERLQAALDARDDEELVGLLQLVDRRAARAVLHGVVDPVVEVAEGRRSEQPEAQPVAVQDVQRMERSQGEASPKPLAGASSRRGTPTAIVVDLEPTEAGEALQDLVKLVEHAPQRVQDERGDRGLAGGELLLAEVVELHRGEAGELVWPEALCDHRPLEVGSVDDELGEQRPRLVRHGGNVERACQAERVSTTLHQPAENNPNAP